MPKYLFATALYVAASVFLIDHGASLTSRVLGDGQDPAAFMWFLSWWPYAILHSLSLHTDLVWQPDGVNLAWTTSIPFLSILAAPVTEIFGPVPAFNLLSLAAPVLAALGAYGLCYELSRSAAGACLGGLVFGFSAYEMAQSFDHLDLACTAAVPLMVLTAGRRVRGAAGRGQTILALAALLTIQFYIFPEVLASALLLAGIAWWLAVWLLPAERAGLQHLLVDAMLAGVMLILAAAPVLRAMLMDHGGLFHPSNWPLYYSVDLASLITPTPFSALGGTLAAPLSQHFTGGLEGQGAYLGLPLLMVLEIWVARGWHDPLIRLWLAMFVIVLLCSLGPRLHVGGMLTGLPLPWALMIHLPLLGAALPARFCLYLWLLAAIGVAAWVASGNRTRLYIALLACLPCLPAPHKSEPNPVVTFFATPGRVTQVLGAAPKILVTPFAITGPSTLWQAEQNFSFSMTGGYLGFPPAAGLRYPAVAELYLGIEGPHLVEDIKAYCALTGTQFIVAAPGTKPALRVVLESLAWQHRTVDDVVIYTVPHG
jgi:hypothetical protein